MLHKLNTLIGWILRRFTSLYKSFFLDINECELKSDECFSNAECTDTVGSYKCSCKKGFEGDGTVCAPIGSLLKLK